MRRRIDPLIAERAPWLYRPGMATHAVRRAIMSGLGYRDTVKIASKLRHQAAQPIMAHMASLLADQVTVSGLHHIPRHGPALVVANHPTGVADGIMLNHILATLRPDLFFYANADILRVLPQLRAMIAPVEWRQGKRSVGKTRETMEYTRAAVAQGRLGVIFPSGRLAKRRGLALHERPWMASAAMIARKFDLPVIPIHIQARNSALFYALDLIHPSLRDITLFYETLNKARQPYKITVGEPISASALPKRSEDGIALLLRATLALSEDGQGRVSMWRATGVPSWIS
ncbi:MAG: 1-acyl-sn-glycerol-3-phosphate acyltransferase [Pseudomonadota bacterium]